MKLHITNLSTEKALANYYAMREYRIIRTAKDNFDPKLGHEHENEHETHRTIPTIEREEQTKRRQSIQKIPKVFYVRKFQKYRIQTPASLLFCISNLAAK